MFQVLFQNDPAKSFFRNNTINKIHIIADHEIKRKQNMHKTNMLRIKNTTNETRIKNK